MDFVFQLLISTLIGVAVGFFFCFIDRYIIKAAKKHSKKRVAKNTISEDHVLSCIDQPNRGRSIDLIVAKLKDENIAPDFQLNCPLSKEQ